MRAAAVRTSPSHCLRQGSRASSSAQNTYRAQWSLSRTSYFAPKFYSLPATSLRPFSTSHIHRSSSETVEDVSQLETELDILSSDLKVKKWAGCDPDYGHLSTLQHVDLIQSHMKEGKVDEAIAVFDAWWLLGSSDKLPHQFAKEFIEFLCRHEKFQALEMYYVELSEHNPQLPRELYQLLWTHWRQQSQYALIVDSFIQMLRARFLGSYIQLLSFLEESPDPERELALLRVHGLPIDASTALVYFRALLKADKIDTARKVFAQAKELLPEFAAQTPAKMLSGMLQDLNSMEGTLRRLQAEQKGELVGKLLQEEITKFNAPVVEEFGKMMREMGMLPGAEVPKPNPLVEAELRGTLGTLVEHWQRTGGDGAMGFQRYLEMGQWLETEPQKEAKLNADFAKQQELEELVAKTHRAEERAKKQAAGLSTADDERAEAEEEAAKRSRITAADLMALWERAKDKAWYLRRAADPSQKQRFLDIIEESLDIITQVKAALNSMPTEAGPTRKALEGIRKTLTRINRRLMAAWPLGISKTVEKTALHQRWMLLTDLLARESLPQFSERIVREKAAQLDLHSAARETLSVLLPKLKGEKLEVAAAATVKKADSFEKLVAELGGNAFLRDEVDEATKLEELRIARLTLKESIEARAEPEALSTEVEAEVAEVQKSISAVTLEAVRQQGADDVRTLIHDCFTLLIQRLAQNGKVDEAVELFDDMRAHWPKVPPALWDTVARGFIDAHRLPEALDFLEVMRRRHRIPDRTTYVALLSAIAHSEKENHDIRDLVLAWARKDALLAKVRETLQDDPLSVFRLSQFLAHREMRRIGSVRAQLPQYAPGTYNPALPTQQPLS